jgi:hypothetical protein
MGDNSLTGITVRWLRYRWAGKVHFSVDQSEPVYGSPLDESMQASFDTPGDYVVRAVVTDGLLQTPYDILIHAK